MTVFRHRVTGNGPAGDVWQCVIHSLSDATTDAVHAAYTTAMVNYLTTVFQPLWAPGTGANETVTDALDGAGHAVAQHRSAVVLAGTAADAAVSQANCVVVSWITAIPGRKGRGRIFLPSPTIGSYAANGQLAARTASTIANGAKAFLDAMRGTATPVLFGKLSLATTPIMDARVNEKISFQRRRLNEVDNSYHVGV